MIKVVFILAVILLLLASSSSAREKTYADWSKFDPGNFDPEHTYSFEIGDIRVVIGDAYPHGGTDRPSYTGIHHLSHRLSQSNVFCPLYAGLIGIRRECTIQSLGENGAILASSKWAPDATETYIIKPPHYVEYTIRFTVQSDVHDVTNCSYMNGPADPGVYVLQTDGTRANRFSAVPWSLFTAMYRTAPLQIHASALAL